LKSFFVDDGKQGWTLSKKVKNGLSRENSKVKSFHQIEWRQGHQLFKIMASSNQPAEFVVCIDGRYQITF